jgi:hypothetical protein
MKSVMSGLEFCILLWSFVFVISCSVLDNKPIQCVHGKVPHSKVSSMKRLSAKAWTMIDSKVFTC